MSKTTLAVVVVLAMAGAAMADSFGTGDNQFSIDFVTISGDTNPTIGIPAGTGFTFTGVDSDYRIGVYEITNDQWDKFQAELGVPVTGDPSYAYDQGPSYAGTNVPTSGVSWYEAAQFANWLNTSTGHQAAYKFTGTQGTSGYAPDIWSPAEAAGGTNLYRHKDAFYYLPTEDEWVKAAYWNGTSRQTYATKVGDTLFQGDGSNGGWNYHKYGDDGPAGPADGPWDVGSGSEELNGTFGMMGNVWEWMESPSSSGDYGAGSSRAQRGSSNGGLDSELASSFRVSDEPPYTETGWNTLGFRVASVGGITYTPGDADVDGDVDLDDFVILKKNFATGTTWGEGDFDLDGDVDLDDFVILKQNFGT